MPSLSGRENFIFEHEVAITPDAHADLSSVMHTLNETAFDGVSSTQDWHLRGIPIRTGALAGNPQMTRNLEYHYMDVLLSTHPNAVEDDLECAISFHGHPLDYSMEVILGQDDHFSIHPDYGRSQRVITANAEDHNGIPTSEMLGFMFRLLGKPGIPEAIQSPDRASFDTRLALQALVAQISATRTARYETTTDHLRGVSLVGNTTTSNEVAVDFLRVRNERPERSETLKLIAQTAVLLWEGVTARKQISYSFRKGEPLDGDHTSVRLKITAIPTIGQLDTAALQEVSQHSLRAAEENLPSELIAAAAILPVEKFDLF